MKWLPGPETRAAIVSNPVFLAGLAVVVLLGLTAAALVVVDSVRGSSGGGTPTVAVQAMTTTTTTPGPVAKTAAAGGVTGTTNRIAAVRQAPGARTPVLGTLDVGNDVVIDGRSSDTKWYRVIFPPDSELHGWISAEFLDVVGDPSTLVVATAEPPIVVDLPTQPPAALTAAAIRRTPTPDSAVTPTPTVDDQLPDLVIGTTPTLADGKLFVTVVNEGKGVATGDLVVGVFTGDGQKLLGGATLPEFKLEAGRSIDVGTGYPITENQTLLLIVDPGGVIKETDETNNRTTVSISVGGEVATPTSEIPVEPPPTDTPRP
jgi:SH3 domain-containing protein/CARDB protein